MGSRLCLVCAAATIAAGRARLLPEGITYRREFDYEFGELRGRGGMFTPSLRPLCSILTERLFSMHSKLEA